MAALRRARALPARARGAARRLRAAEHEPARRPRGGDGRARDRRLGLDAGGGRQADAARGGAEGRAGVPEGPAGALPGRRRRVLGDGRGGRSGDRGPAARDRRDRLPLPAARHRDRRRDRPRRRGRARRRGRPRRAGAARRDPAALGRLADGGHAAAARGRRAREVVQDPGLHGGARHARGRRRVQPLRRRRRIIPVPPDKPTHAPDRRSHRRPLLRGGERRRPARCIRQRWDRS